MACGDAQVSTGVCGLCREQLAHLCLRILKTQPGGIQRLGEEEVKMWVTLAEHREGAWLSPKALQKPRYGGSSPF